LLLVSFSIGWLARAVLFSGTASAAVRPIRPPANGIVVSLSRQRLYEYHHGHLTNVLRISTASGNRYFSKRQRRWVRATTPRGAFRIRAKAHGWKRSAYGRLYYPSYYDRAGRALHGYRDLRPHHSHGCIRIPMRAAIPFWRRNPVGTPVYIE
jgi:lipoprotein-anchoring transpeptidase ErfK/SrfK